MSWDFSLSSLYLWAEISADKQNVWRLKWIVRWKDHGSKREHFNSPNLRNRSGGRAFMKSWDILTAQLGRKVTCPRPRWYFTVCWAEVTLMTSLSPEMLGRYSATLLSGFTTQIRKWLHLLGFRTRPVYQFYPEEVCPRGATRLSRSFGHTKRQTSSCIFFSILQKEQFLHTLFLLLSI